jgi:ribosomal-protein-alanine N-acetyltransferase
MLLINKRWPNKTLEHILQKNHPRGGFFYRDDVAMQQDFVIHRLERSAITELTILDQKVSIIPWTEKLFDSEFDHSFALVIGGYIEKNIISFAVLHRVIDQAHLVHCGVHPDFRRRGFGKQMLHWIIKDLSQQDVCQLDLEVRESNHSARRLYEGLHFSQIGRRKSYYSDNGEDAIVLRRELHKPSPLHF